MRTDTIDTIKKRFEVFSPFIDERLRRLWAATEARAVGHGGIVAVAQATGLSRTTITRGMNELRTGRGKTRRIRQGGGGRRCLVKKIPAVTMALEQLIEPDTRGDPMSPLRWTCKSTRTLAEELTRQGYALSHGTVATLLQQLGYSLQSNRKRYEGKQHPDRNAQFEYIHGMTTELQERGLPVIAVDAKKNELIGNFKNPGREWTRHSEATEVNVDDFPDPGGGKAIPYGVYDQTRNEGWVSVGVDHNTAMFAGESIRRWWRQMGQFASPLAQELLILADGGGSHGSRSRLWKHTLQQFADETAMKVVVGHFPPGTSKWNKIEHRRFCQITENWGGRPLLSHEVVVNLIGATTTKAGVKITAPLDTSNYPTGITIRDEQIRELTIITADFHGEWNYALCSRQK
jgi:transposase